MNSLKNIILDDKSTQEIKGMVEVYEDIAAKKMKIVRSEIIVSRDYYEGVSRLSIDIGADFKNLEVGNQAEAAVFLSANQGLFGDIVGKVFADFLKYISVNKNVSIFVSGKVGVEMMRILASNIKYTYVEIADAKVEDSELSLVWRQLADFKKITVFYGKYKSLANQEGGILNLSGEMVENLQGTDLKNKEKKLRYIYEPTLQAISQKFAKEILAVLFEESLRENQLAKYASRLMSLDTAIENINIKLKSLEFSKRKAFRKIEDKKQRERIGRLTYLSR
jgi:F0F1-type ATP synthase gamma subunit